MKRISKKLKNWLNKKKDKKQRSGKKRKFIVSVGLVMVIWFSPLKPKSANGIGLSLPSSRSSIERIQGYEYSSKFKNFLKITPTFIENSDKIVLTNNQVDILFGWLSGKYDSKGHLNHQSMANPPSRFERETLHMMKRMCVASSDENGFVMDYDAAYNLIKETYSGSMQITEDLKISDWQAASHLYHGKGVGVIPEDYGLTEPQLEEIRNDGLVSYVQRGKKLPSREHVKTYQKALKDICENPSTGRRDDTKYYYKHGVTPTTVFFNDRYIVSFNQTNGDLITGYKQRLGTVKKFLKTNTLGGKKWIEKWSK